MQNTQKISQVLLIHSAHYHEDGSLVHARRWIDKITISNFEKLSLLLIAAYTPKHIEVQKIDDYFEEIPWETDAEVIGIHAQVMQAKRAFEIADQFKKRGKVVVMGGYLPSQYPELSLLHVDAVCIGDGDLVWPEMLCDIESGKLQKIYRGSHTANLDNIPIPRYDLAAKHPMTVLPVQATRGCPFDCEYCCITSFYKRSYRLRPIDQVIRDIKATKSKMIHFTDDNLMENREYAKSLFKEMAKLKLTWGTQCTLNIAEDDELLSLAYRAGCRYVAVGVESINQKNLNQVSKEFNKVDHYREIFSKIQSHGIAIHALIVFGMPEDTAETFIETRVFLEEMNVAIAEFFIMTPYEKTPYGSKIFKDDLILDKDLNHFRESYFVFKHKHLSPLEIRYYYWKTLRDFYSLKSIFKRILKATFKDKIFHLITNLYFLAKIKRGIIPVYFGAGNIIPSNNETLEEFKRRLT